MSYVTQNVTPTITHPKPQEQDSWTSAQKLPCNYSKVNLRSRKPSSSASSQASAEEKPLFMASERTRTVQRSLSPISNRPPRKANGQSEPNVKSHNEQEHENMAWDIINKEITEWQNVCRTGRPSWWPPMSEWTGEGTCSNPPQKAQAIPPWRLGLDQGDCPRTRCEEQRRALTDGYLVDSKNVQDLAHLIAVQLLSACFTLPPDQISSYKSTAYHCFDTPDCGDMPGSRLISSLRMHTEVRFSPSFGHQARNTSPAYRWQRPYDGQSPSRSPAWSSDQQSVDIESSGKTCRRRKVHRALHVTEGSAAECSMHSHAEQYNGSDVQPTAASTSWCRRKGVKQPAWNLGLPQSPDQRIQSCLPLTGGIDHQLLDISSLGSSNFHAHTIDVLQSSRDIRMTTRPSRYTLQPVIRSEPHRVYIQPVKELVVKRWRTFRRRFGNSLTRGSPDPASTAADFMVLASTPASAFASPCSTPSESSGSPTHSSDGKKRRRQARETGDIHSSSIQSSPRYNTPASAAGSGAVSPTQIESSFHTEHADQIEAAAATPNVIEDLRPSPLVSPTGSLSSMTESGSFSSPSTDKSKSAQSAHSFSPRRQGRRQQRKSMLSEMCTPDDIEEQGILSAAGSALASSREESSSEAAAGLPSQSQGVGMEIEVPMRLQEPSSPEMTGSSPGPDGISEQEEGEMRVQRPKIVRTSTNGTQMFTPSEDGMEIDGLPVGPIAEVWDDQRKGRERRERSFL